MHCIRLSCISSRQATGDRLVVTCKLYPLRQFHKEMVEVRNRTAIHSVKQFSNAAISSTNASTCLKRLCGMTGLPLLQQQPVMLTQGQQPVTLAQGQQIPQQTVGPNQMAGLVSVQMPAQATMCLQGPLPLLLPSQHCQLIPGQGQPTSSPHLVIFIQVLTKLVLSSSLSASLSLFAKLPSTSPSLLLFCP